MKKIRNFCDHKRERIKSLNFKMIKKYFTYYYTNALKIKIKEFCCRN
jgi:hypothetical protein